MDYKATATRECQGRTMEVGYCLHVHVWYTGLQSTKLIPGPNRNSCMHCRLA